MSEVKTTEELPASPPQLGGVCLSEALSEGSSGGERRLVDSREKKERLFSEESACSTLVSVGEKGQVALACQQGSSVVVLPSLDAAESCAEWSQKWRAAGAGNRMPQDAVWIEDLHSFEDGGVL